MVVLTAGKRLAQWFCLHCKVKTLSQSNYALTTRNTELLESLILKETERNNVLRELENKTLAKIDDLNNNIMAVQEQVSIHVNQAYRHLLIY